MYEQIESLHQQVLRGRQQLLASADLRGREAASDLWPSSAATPTEPSDADVETATKRLAAVIAAQADPFFTAAAREESALLQGRRDPWGVALSNLEQFVWLCWALTSFPVTTPPSTSSRELVGQLQVEACRIALEVVHLLRGGFYGGAMARWRTIYELLVVGEFVCQHGDDAARRFRDHEAQQRHRWLRDLKSYGPGWDMEQLTAEQAAEIDRAYRRARERHGDEFAASDYGWAAPFIDRQSAPAGARAAEPNRVRRRGRARLADLEDSLGVQRWRVYSVMASAYVHGRLSTGPDEPGYDSLNLRLALVAPSDGHVGAVTALCLSSLNQSVLELGADRTNPTDLKRVQLIGAAVERIRHDVDAEFTAVEQQLAASSGPAWRQADWLRT